jgi:hypothetical protein
VRILVARLIRDLRNKLLGSSTLFTAFLACAGPRSKRMGIFRIKLLGTFGAYPMAKVSLRVFRNIRLKLIPITLVIPYFLTRGAHGQQATQLFYPGKRLSQLGD